MKTRLSVLFLAVFGCTAFSYDDVTFDTSIVVPVEASYGKVTVVSPAGNTIVDYYGFGEQFETFGNSILNIHDGATMFCDFTYPGHIMHDTSTVNLYGSIGITSMSALWVRDSAVLNILGGDIGTFMCGYQSSIINLYDGNLGYGFNLYDNSILNVYGGSITAPQLDSFSELSETTTLNFYGYGFVYEENPGWGQSPGKLSGFDLNGNPVTYYGIPDPATHLNIHFIPEPNILLLCLAGIPFLRKRFSK
jgi:hypothetical protein